MLKVNFVVGWDRIYTSIYCLQKRLCTWKPCLIAQPSPFLKWRWLSTMYNSEILQYYLENACQVVVDQKHHSIVSTLLGIIVEITNSNLLRKCNIVPHLQHSIHKNNHVYRIWVTVTVQLPDRYLIIPVYYHSFRPS